MTDDPIVSTTFRVEGVPSDAEVRVALQALYDVFTDLGLGQATFEVTDTGPARLVVKHKRSVTPDREAVARALAGSGGLRLVD